jgi:hypothetical protein
MDEKKGKRLKKKRTEPSMSSLAMSPTFSTPLTSPALLTRTSTLYHIAFTAQKPID